MSYLIITEDQEFFRSSVLPQAIVDSIVKEQDPVTLINMREGTYLTDEGQWETLGDMPEELIKIYKGNHG